MRVIIENTINFHNLTIYAFTFKVAVCFTISVKVHLIQFLCVFLSPCKRGGQ